MKKPRVSYEDMIAEAEKIGKEHGYSAGTWVFDGNTSISHILHVLQGWEDGDPAILDIEPNPLSGEWVDSYSPKQLSLDCGQLDEDVNENFLEIQNDLCDAYQAAYSEAFWVEVVRSGKAMVGENDA